MSWPNEKLGSLCEKIGSGITPRGGASVYVEDGTALIRSQNVELLLPTDQLLDGFHAQVEPIQAQIGLLERQASQVAIARDFLLPRLMNGSLEV